jgi:hypothetical protein
MICNHCDLFTTFIPSTGRLNILMLNTMFVNNLYCKLGKVVKMLLVLSHGQATVECGFSINKPVETDHLYEESVVANRTICDYVSYIGGINNVGCQLQKADTSSSSPSEIFVIL